MNNRKRIYVLILGFLYLCLNSEIKGQSTYNILIDHEYQSEWGMSLLIEDDTIVLIGTTNVFIDSFYRDGIFFRKFNLEGEIVLEVFYADVCTLYFIGNSGNLVKQTDSYIASGAFQYCDSTFIEGIGSKGIIYNFNFHGDTIRTSKFDGKDFTLFYRGIATTEGSYLAAGVTIDTTDIIHEFYIVKTDSLGQIVWEKTFSYLLNNYAFSIDSYSNGNFVVGGITDPTTAFSETDGYLAKLDSLGNLIWQKKIGTTEDDAGILVRISEDENNLFIKQSIDTLVNVGDEMEPDYVGKLDNNGNFIWRTFFNGPYKQDVIGIREMENKSIIAIGIKDVDDLGKGRGFICKLDSNGVKLWERTYYSRTDRDNYFTDVAKVADGGFILTGTAWSDTDQDVWLVRLDSMGCLEPGCDIVNVNEIYSSVTNIFNIYPNPMHNVATVEIKIPNNFQVISGAKLSLLIVDVSGKIVDEYANIAISNPGENIRFSAYKKNLSSGFYNAILKYGNTNLGNIKIIID